MPDVFTAKKKTPIHAVKTASKTVDELLKKIRVTTDPNLPHGKVGLFTNFSLFPEGLTIENQEADEILVLFLRRDLATNIPWIIVSVLLLFVPALLPLLPDMLSLSFLTPAYILVITLFYYLLVVGFVLVNFISWLASACVTAEAFLAAKRVRSGELW